MFTAVTELNLVDYHTNAVKHNEQMCSIRLTYNLYPLETRHRISTQEQFLQRMLPPCFPILV